MLYLLQFYSFFILVCLVLSNSFSTIVKNYFLITLLMLAVYAEGTSSLAAGNATYFYTSLLARSVFIPSAYLYFRNRVCKINWSLRDLIHLLPFCLLVITGIAVYVSGPDLSKGENNYISSGSPVQSLMLFVIYSTTGLYFLLLLQLFKSSARSWFEQETLKKSSPVNANTNILTDKQISRMDKLVKEFLETNKPFLQQRYSLKDLAEGTHIPLHHLSAFINKHYGVNFNDFINGFRVQYCKQKILNRECEQKKLEAIAQESGFSNRNTFTSAFKKVTGVNPSEFLKTASVPHRKVAAHKQESTDGPAGVQVRYKLAVDHYS